MPTTTLKSTPKVRTPHPDAHLYEQRNGALTPMRPYRFDDPAVSALETAAYDRRVAFENFRHLWRMTPQERVAAMWRGELSLAECLAWSGHAPDEVPLIGNEFAYIVMHTPEWLGDDD